jgi:hypothetical protein
MVCFADRTERRRVLNTRWNKWVAPTSILIFLLCKHRETDSRSEARDSALMNEGRFQTHRLEAPGSFRCPDKLNPSYGWAPIWGMIWRGALNIHENDKAAQCRWCVKVKAFLCLTKHHTTKTCEGVEVQLHAFLTSAPGTYCFSWRCISVLKDLVCFMKGAYQLQRLYSSIDWDEKMMKSGDG